MPAYVPLLLRAAERAAPQRRRRGLPVQRCAWAAQCARTYVRTRMRTRHPTARPTRRRTPPPPPTLSSAAPIPAQNKRYSPRVISRISLPYQGTLPRELNKRAGKLCMPYTPPIAIARGEARCRARVEAAARGAKQPRPPTQARARRAPPRHIWQIRPNAASLPRRSRHLRSRSPAGRQIQEPGPRRASPTPTHGVRWCA